MYSFKFVDYSISNQMYLFKLIDELDEQKYKFMYIPINEFPALLMLNHILAKGDNEFNIDLFNYYSNGAEVSLDRYGANDILLMSSTLGERNVLLNKLSITTRDIPFKFTIDWLRGAESYTRKGVKGGVETSKITDRDIIYSKTFMPYIDKILMGEVSRLYTATRDIIFGFTHHALEGNLDSIKGISISRMVDGEIVNSRISSTENNIGITLDNSRGGDVVNFNNLKLNRETTVDYILSIDRDNYLSTDIFRGFTTKRDTNYSATTIPIIQSNRDDVEDKFSSLKIYESSLSRHGLELDTYNLTRYEEVVGDIGLTLQGTVDTSRLSSLRSINIHATRDVEVNATKLDVLGGLNNKTAEIINGEIFESYSNFDKIFISIALNDIDRYSSKSYHTSGVRVNELQGTVDKIYELSSFNESSLELIQLTSNEVQRDGEVIYLTTTTRELQGVGYISYSEVVSREFQGRGSTIEVSNLDKSIDGDFLDHWVAKEQNIRDGFINFKAISDKEMLSEVIGFGLLDKEKTSNTTITKFSGFENNRFTELITSSVSRFDNARDGFINFKVISDKEMLSEVIGLELLDKEKTSNTTITKFSGFENNRFTELITSSVSRFDNARDGFITLGGYADYEKDVRIDKYFNSIIESGLGGIIHYNIQADTELDTLILNVVRDIREQELSSKTMYGLDLMRLTDDVSSYQGFLVSGYGGETREGIVSKLSNGTPEVFRETDIIFTMEAYKPRKQLLKSFLVDGARDRYQLEISWGFNGTRINNELELTKSTLFVSHRDLKDNIKYLQKEDNLTTTLREPSKELQLGKNFILGGARDTSLYLDKEYEVDADKWHDVSIEELTHLDKNKDTNIEKLINFNKNKDTNIEKLINFNKFGHIDRDRFILYQDTAKGLLYDYSNIIDDGMDVAKWDEGYAIPEDYNPKDPFNPYYPWIDVVDRLEITQEKEWVGDWEIDKENSTFESIGGMLLSEFVGNDYKFRFDVKVGETSDCRVGFVFDYKDENNYYKFTLSSGPTPFLLVQVIGGMERLVATAIENYFLDGGSTHRVEVLRDKDRLHIYTDGRLQYDLVLEVV